VVLGAVIEKHSGAVSFVNAGSKRWQARKRQRGFGTPQMDVSIALPLAEVKRFIIHARTRVRGNPADVVLFLSEGATNTAELPTTLVRRTGTTTTVLASGHDTSDGLFLRNESLIHPNLRAACDAFDYGRVTGCRPTPQRLSRGRPVRDRSGGRPHRASARAGRSRRSQTRSVRGLR
jgi:hypothetical protein